MFFFHVKPFKIIHTVLLPGQQYPAAAFGEA